MFTTFKNPNEFLIKKPGIFCKVFEEVFSFILVDPRMNYVEPNKIILEDYACTVHEKTEYFLSDNKTLLILIVDLSSRDHGTIEKYLYDKEKSPLQYVSLSSDRYEFLNKIPRNNFEIIPISNQRMQVNIWFDNIDFR